MYANASFAGNRDVTFQLIFNIFDQYSIIASWFTDESLLILFYSFASTVMSTIELPNLGRYEDEKDVSPA